MNRSEPLPAPELSAASSEIPVLVGLRKGTDLQAFSTKRHNTARQRRRPCHLRSELPRQALGRDASHEHRLQRLRRLVHRGQAVGRHRPRRSRRARREIRRHGRTRAVPATSDRVTFVANATKVRRFCA